VEAAQQKEGAMMFRSTTVWGVAIACVLLAAAASAQDEGAGMKTTFALGATFTDGNSETMQANVSLVTEGERESLGSVRAGIEGNYGETTVDDESETTVENAKAFAHVRKTLSELTFAYIDTSALYDDIARVDYRITLGPGLGTYLVKSESTALSLELGLAYVWEDVADDTDDYVAARAAERLEHKISETARVWQSVEYIPQTDDFDDYLLNGEIGVEAALNASLNLRIVVQDKYDSRPAPGLERNDVSLIAGISVNL
jgi:putative salt-induced outer membrane protein YdiY